MLSGLKSRLNDVATLRTLCEEAEKHALLDQQAKPGAEHFLLAAFDLKDGTARLAFEKAGASPSALKPAISRQYEDALGSLGIRLKERTEGQAERQPLPANTGPYDAAPSGQEVMRKLAADRKNHGPLLGSHVVAIVAGMKSGVAARALRNMGVDPDVLKSAAEEIARKAVSQGAG